MGLIQRIIESSGLPTISISINCPYTEKIKPPRSIYVDWPFGHPLGEPGQVAQQAAVLTKLFEALYAIDTPGMMIDVGWPLGAGDLPASVMAGIAGQRRGRLRLCRVGKRFRAEPQAIDHAPYKSPRLSCS